MDMAVSEFLGFLNLSWQIVTMLVVGGLLIYLGIAKDVEPVLLIPIGAAGTSAFPMSARVVQRVGLQANPHNHLLMHAAGANTAGQIASVVAGGAMLMLVTMFS